MDLAGGKQRSVVHVRADSGTEMDELFRCISEGGLKKVQQVPMRDRNLPKSFFTEPTQPRISHSRESSADSTNYNSGNITNASPNIATRNLGPPPPMTIAHSRAHSSPASLQEMRSVNPQEAIRNQHLRQQSYDISDEPQLPPGWEMAITPSGQKYFLE